MNVRDTLQKYKGVVIAVVIVAIVWCVISIIRTTAGTSYSKLAYYSVDDGKTFFTDDFTKRPPFMVGGKEAVAAVVFQKPNGKRFVGYLSRYPASAIKAMEQFDADMASGKFKNTPPPSAGAASAALLSIEHKRPGATEWSRNPSWLPMTGMGMKDSDGVEGQLCVP